MPYSLLLTSHRLRSRPPPARATWSKVLDLAARTLSWSAAGKADPIPSALAIAASAGRIHRSTAEELLRLVRRSLAFLPPGSEPALRCLRVLARAGDDVDVHALAAAIPRGDRGARVALSALGDLAARGDHRAVTWLQFGLTGALRADAALLLAWLCTDQALDSLSVHLSAPGQHGAHAAGALLAAEDDPFAFQSLCERLCRQPESALSARLLWGAAPDGRYLRFAEALLARWTRRGIARASQGRTVAAAALTAGGVAQDLSATQHALSSGHDELVLIGAQAAWHIGDTERARIAAMALMRRGPILASSAFALLVKWADCGDRRSWSVVRRVLERRPVDLPRSAVLDALAQAESRDLSERVERALTLPNPGVALDAARAIAKASEPPSVVPGFWL